MPYNKQKPDSIQSMFDNIASRYDRANSVLSFGLHKRWNRQLIDRVLINHSSHSLLDLCAGTGDIAFGYLKKCPHPCQAHLVDFSPHMLALAKQKESLFHLSSHQIHYHESDVQRLSYPDQSFDRATMAYGIRNVKDPRTCLREVHRVLKNGGCLGILELTQPKNYFIRVGHRLYLQTILPILGKWITSNKDAYQYLCDSIQTFVAPNELKLMLEKEGFQSISVTPLMGGIATIVRAQKM